MSAVTVLRVRSVSRRVQAFLARPRAGYVLATFARSCYLDLGDQIVALVAPDLRNGPLNIVVETEGTVDGIVAGSSVSTTPHAVHIEGCGHIGLDDAAGWDTRVTRWSSTAMVGLQNHMEVLRTLLAVEAPVGGLARAAIDRHTHTTGTTLLEAHGGWALSRLWDGLRGSNPVLVAETAGRLAGLGPGLTPSGDDILVGILLACAVWPTDRHAAIRDVITSAARGRTTRISAAYLDAAALGEATEGWHELLAALTMSDIARVTETARRVITVGETSGSDMLGGFVLAVTALLA